MSINLYRPEVYSPEKWFAVQKEKINGYFCPEIYEEIIDASPYIERKYFEYSLVCAQWCCLVRVRILKLINNKNLFKNNALGLSSEANQLAFLSAYKDRCKVLTVDYFFSRETFLNLIPSLSQLIELHLNSLPWLTNDILRELTSLRSLSTLAIIGIRNGITDEQFESIALFSNLKALEIKCRITDKTTHEIGKIQGLSKLKLKAASITDEGLKQLRSLPLTELDLSGCEAITGKPLSYFINTLISLNLKDCVNVGSSSFRWIAQLVNLVKLNINGTSVNNGELNHLKMLTKLSKLVLIDGIDKESFGFLSFLKNLSQLSIDGSIFTYEIIENLQSLCSIKLENLYLHNLNYLIPLTKLSNLSLMNSDVENGCIHGLGYLLNLNKLEIMHSKIGQEICIHLTNLKKLSKLTLEYLCDPNNEFGLLHSLDRLSHFSCNEFEKIFTVEGLDRLAKLTSLSHLILPPGNFYNKELQRLSSLKNLSTFVYNGEIIPPLSLSIIGDRKKWFLKHSLYTKYEEFQPIMQNFINDTAHILNYAILSNNEIDLLKKLIEIYRYNIRIFIQMNPGLDVSGMSRIFFSNESAAFLFSEAFRLILKEEVDGITENGKRNAENFVYYLRHLAECQLSENKLQKNFISEQGIKRKAESEISKRPFKVQKKEDFVDNDVPTMEAMEFILDQLFPNSLDGHSDSLDGHPDSLDGD